MDQAPDRSDGDAIVEIHRLQPSDHTRAYVCERTLLLSELEAEFRAKGA